MNVSARNRTAALASLFTVAVALAALGVSVRGVPLLALLPTESPPVLNQDHRPAGGHPEEPFRNNRRTPVVEVFEKCRDAVVNISTSRIVRGDSFLEEVFDLPPQRVSNLGSGFIIHEDGYIITNAHVVTQANDVLVTLFNNSTLPAETVAVDTEHDLAVIKIKSDRPLPFLRLAASDDIMVGENVVAIGNPLGLQHTVTSGIVSAINRELRFNRNVVYHGLIQTDTPINPGNSGGPLLNVNSELMGINSAIRGDAQNIGFAIPVKHLWELLPLMLDIERRERVRVGLDVVGRDAEVQQVRADSPAQKSGIQRGDRVVKFNGKQLGGGSIDYYVRLLEQTPGEKMKLTIQRGEKTLTADVPLEVIPPPDGAALSQNLLGTKLVEISPQRRTSLERKLELKLPPSIGIMVDSVQRGSPADAEGIERGDIIVRMGRVPVPRLEEVGLLLEKLDAGDKIVIEVLRSTANGSQLGMAAVQIRRPK